MAVDELRGLPGPPLSSRRLRVGRTSSKLALENYDLFLSRLAHFTVERSLSSFERFLAPTEHQPLAAAFSASFPVWSLAGDEYATSGRRRRWRITPFSEIIPPLCKLALPLGDGAELRAG